MRKTVLLIAAVATALVFASGIAYAKAFVFPNPDTGSHAEEELPLMNEAEVQKAIDNGTLIEVE